MTFLALLVRRYVVRRYVVRRYVVRRYVVRRYVVATNVGRQPFFPKLDSELIRNDNDDVVQHSTTGYDAYDRMTPTTTKYANVIRRRRQRNTTTLGRP